MEQKMVYIVTKDNLYFHPPTSHILKVFDSRILALVFAQEIQGIWEENPEIKICIQEFSLES